MANGDVPLSDEQRGIVDLVVPPTAPTPSIVRVTAAAGSGKTTVLLSIARRARELGHRCVTYLTFNRVAAQEGKLRLQQALQGGKVQAYTLHGCAAASLAAHRARGCSGAEQSGPSQMQTQTQTQTGGNPQDLSGTISEICDSAITAYLREAEDTIDRTPTNIGTRQQQKRAARRQVVFFINKTLEKFCRSSSLPADLADPSNPRRHHRRAREWHEGEEGKAAGFAGYEAAARYGFYADQAALLYTELAEVSTYNLWMKRAQLAGAEIAGTLILVDEAQDLDACQLAWIELQQRVHCKHVFVVGDPAQAIYSFRGARPHHLMALRGCVDRTLTRSWRFGPAIGNIANVVLSVKERCPQTNLPPWKGQTPTWHPYRLVGAGSPACRVTTKPLSPDWKSGKVTILGYTNAALMEAAFRVLGAAAAGEVPKMRINGSGASSGAQHWKAAFTVVDKVFDLFVDHEEGRHTAGRMLFVPGIGNKMQTWPSLRDLMAKESAGVDTRYRTAFLLVNRLGMETPTAVALIQRDLVDTLYSAHEASITFSTCHAAKGMEWDRVEILDDGFSSLSSVVDTGPPVWDFPPHTRSASGPPAKRRRRSTWQFRQSASSDDLNLLYVACTRAKTTLRIPASVSTLLRGCDELHRGLATTSPGCALTAFGSRLLVEQARDLYNDLCEPLRKELGVPPGSRLEQFLLDE
ncbi:hypothetical protein DIPPA_16675 [Diplonema papillatum]|nr:hypothetical protein DIPPA_16675 [Diplonema papillatum]